MAKEKNNKNFFLKILTNNYIKAIIAMAIVGVLLIFVVLYGLSLYTKHGEAVAVPTVIGMQVEEAASALQKASLKYEIVDSIFLTNGIPGAITDQVPEANSNVKKNRTVFLTMQAKNVEMVTIPLLQDFSSRQAISTLNSLGFSQISVSEAPSPYKGIVINVTHRGRSLKANEKLPKGDPIGLVVGSGYESFVDSLMDITTSDTETNKHTEDDLSIDNSFFE